MKFAFIFVLFLSAAFAYRPVEQDKEGQMLCTGCKTVVTVVEKWLASNKTVTEIADALDVFCQLFNNTSLQKPCEEVVRFGVGAVIELLERRFPPETVCGAIGLCEKMNFRILPFKVQEASVFPMYTNAEAVPMKGGVVLCDGCKILVNAMHAWVNSDSMRYHIDAFFDKMCLLFNGTDFQPVCENIVEFGIDKVIEYIQSKLTPQVVCQFIKLCPTVEEFRTEEPVLIDDIMIEETPTEDPEEPDYVDEDFDAKYQKYKKFYEKHKHRRHHHHRHHHHRHHSHSRHFARHMDRRGRQHGQMNRFSPFHKMMKAFKPFLEKFDDIAITVIEDNDMDTINEPAVIAPSYGVMPLIPPPISEQPIELNEPSVEPKIVDAQSEEAEKPQRKVDDLLDRAKQYFDIGFNAVKKWF